MNLAILKVLPWREIIDWTPAVVSMVANMRKPPEPNADSGERLGEFEQLRIRVASVESVQHSQAEAFARMAEQGEKLAQVVQVLAARVVVLAWVAGAALLLSIVLAGRELLT
ncbi:MAG: hypothetical protein ACREV9_06535 [Burkholderiales bacterium]